MYCEKCGYQYPDRVQTCPNCGARSSGASPQAQSSAGNWERRMEMLIGDKHYYYMYENHTFNPCGLIFAPWMAYRKMYGWCALFFSISTLMGVFIPFSGILLNILLCFFINRLYMRHINSLYEKSKYFSEEDFYAFSKAKGETSWRAVGACIIIVCIFLRYV